MSDVEPSGFDKETADQTWPAEAADPAEEPSESAANDGTPGAVEEK